MDTLNTKKDLIKRAPFILILLVAIFTLSFSQDLYSEVNFKVLKTDPEGRMAVIRTSDGEMKVIRTGDKIRFHNKEFRISAIREDTLVLQSTDEAERIIIQIAEKEQRVKRIRKDFRGSTILGVK